MDADAVPPLDLRKVRYFVAVAEELHFGRAAERLYITQPVLSRQIRKLEQEIGAPLLVRSSRQVALTPVGLKLLDEGRSLLAASELAQRRVAGVARREASLTIAFFIGEDFTAAYSVFSETYPDVEINLVRIYGHDQTAVLRDGRADIAFVHLPVDDHGLELVPLRAEPRVAAVAANHPATALPEVSLADLADDPVVVDRGSTSSWQAFASVDPRPSGLQPQRGPSASNLAENLLHVATGRAVSFLPRSMADNYGQPGVKFVPVTDIAPIRVCLAWTRTNESALVAEFARCVVDASR